MVSQRDYLQPGPIDPSVLYLQDQHRSKAVWYNIDGAETSVLDCRRNTSTRPEPVADMHPRVVALLRQSAFYGLSRIGFFQIDHHLITALVERWRPETHTFHLPEGECTITLQDVAIQTGLPIDGRALIGPAKHDWVDLCVRLLGRAPPEHSLKGSLVKLSWLIQDFPMPTDEADDLAYHIYTRAYILRLLAGYVFVTKDTGRANLLFLPYLADFGVISQYSWGSACLAYLFRQLCRACRFPLVSQISGPLFLLQAWAWDRFQFLAPSISVRIPVDAPLAARWSQGRDVTQIPTHVLVDIRYRLDTSRQDMIIWEPYTDDILRALPAYCLHGRDTWTALVPLICIQIVEWHPADRVLRQFGYQQPLPHHPIKIEHLHSTDLRQGVDNWAEHHAHWLQLWDNRAHWVQHGPCGSATLHYHSQYMEWYRSITRRWIGIPGASVGSSADSFEHIAVASDLDYAQRVAQSIQRAIGEERRRVTIPPPQSAALSDAPYPTAPPDSVAQTQRQRSKRQVDVPVPPQAQCDPVPRPLFFHQNGSQSTSGAGPSSSTMCSIAPTHSCSEHAQFNYSHSTPFMPCVRLFGMSFMPPTPSMPFMFFSVPFMFQPGYFPQSSEFQHYSSQLDPMTAGMFRPSSSHDAGIFQPGSSTSQQPNISNIATQHQPTAAFDNGNSNDASVPLCRSGSGNVNIDTEQRAQRRNANASLRTTARRKRRLGS